MTIGTPSIGPLTPDTQASQADKIRKAAAGFEALFVAQLLRSARESSAPAEDQSGSAMMEIAEEQIAQAISDSGGLGLSQSIVDSLKNINQPPPKSLGTPGSPAAS